MFERKRGEFKKVDFEKKEILLDLFQEKYFKIILY